MTIYEVIAEMRSMTKNVESFSFTFLSYSNSRRVCNGIVEVPNARLRPRNLNEFNQYAELQEDYINVSTGELSALLALLSTVIQW